VGSRLLGLDFQRESRLFWIDPFFHVAAYGAVEREARLVVDFADLPTSLVVRPPLPPEQRPTPYLELRPWRLRAADFEFFEYALVDALPIDWPLFERKYPHLAKVCDGGRFRLYRVIPVNT